MNQLNLLFDLLFSPVGALIVGLAAITVAIGLRNRWLIPYFLTLPLFVSCFGKYRHVTQSYAFPLEHILTYSRPLFIGGLLALIAICVFLLPKRSNRSPHIASIFFLIFQLVYATRLVLEGDTEFGYLAVLTYAIGCFAVYFLRGSLPADKELASEYFCRAFTATGVLFSTACLYQYLSNPGASSSGGRFIGISNNPIHTGEFCSWFLMSTIAIMWTAYAEKQKRLFWILSIIAAVHLTIIFATGSRTAFVLLLSGLFVLFRNRMGKLFLPGLLALVALGALNQMSDAFSESTAYLTSGKDSRTRLFSVLWERFLEHPLVGEAELMGDSGRMRIRESSYLTAAANLGLVGLAPLVACMIAYWNSARRAIERESSLRQNLIFCDWALAIIASAFVAAIFEGFLFAIVGPAALLMHIGFSLIDSPVTIRPTSTQFEHTKPRSN